jgi:hypothetical protein
MASIIKMSGGSMTYVGKTALQSSLGTCPFGLILAVLQRGGPAGTSKSGPNHTISDPVARAACDWASVEVAS